MQGADAAGRFGDYELVHLLGKGGTGETFLARGTRGALQGELVCLKRLGQQYQSPSYGRYYQRQVAVQSLQLEAQVLGQFTHPNIPRLLDHGSVDDVAFLVFELVEGANLWELLELRQGLSAEHARLIVAEVANAVQYAHEQDVLHRDIKPGNILVGKDGRVHLVDFGVAKREYQSAQRFTVVGTSAYWAPEQATGAGASPQTDIYALGVVLWEVVTHELPGDFIVEGVHDLPTALPSIPPQLREIIERCVQPNVEDRYRSASELERALRACSFTAPETELGFLAGRMNELRRELPQVVARDADQELSGVGGIHERITRTAQRSEALGAVQEDSRVTQVAQVHQQETQRATVSQLAEGALPPADRDQAAVRDLLQMVNDAMQQRDRARPADHKLPSRRSLLPASLALLLLVAAGFGAWSFGRAEPPANEAAIERDEQGGTSEPNPDSTPPVPPTPAAAAVKPAAERPTPAAAPSPPQELARNRTSPQPAQRKALLEVGLIPRGEVFVDGRSVGPAPARLRVRPGRHRIEGRLNGRSVTRVEEVAGDTEIVINMRGAPNAQP